MANVHDVAAYILKNHGEMTAMKLQKLAYYSQAWSLVWDEDLLFPETIEAWANGPVIPALYQKHRGAFKVANWLVGDPSALNQKQIDTVNAVLSFYGDKTSQWLSELTHQEPPWRDSRDGLAPSDRGHKVIPPSSMAEYYSSLK